MISILNEILKTFSFCCIFMTTIIKYGKCSYPRAHLFSIRHVAKDLRSVEYLAISHLPRVKCPISGQLFMFLETHDMFIYPAVRQVTFMSCLYSNQLLESSRPTD